MRYEVLVPSAMYESESVLDLDRAHDICYDLAEEHGYAEIRLNGHHIADYGNPAVFLWHLRGCPLSPPFPPSTDYPKGVAGREPHQIQHFSSKPMKFYVSDINFDFSDDCYELSRDEKIDIIDDSIGYWDAENDEDLVEEITCATGYCINSINYEIILT